MAIQAQFYPSSTNDMMLSSPFCNTNNGYCADGFNIVESCFNSQHKHHHQQQQLEQRLQQFYNESQRPIIDPTVLVYSPKVNNNHHHSLNSSPGFVVQNNQFEMQREQIDQEIDQFIVLQNAKLRHMIQEQGKQQMVALLRKVESRSLFMLREKDQEIAEATKKRVELEEYLRRLEAENQAWQRMAQENEAMALTLHKTLEDMIEKGCSFGSVAPANDAESCCDESKEEENNESEKFEEIIMKDEMMMMVCKNCHCRKSCYLFLPCRHLSSCKDCDAFLKVCPVCQMPKKASIETLIF